MLKNYIDRLKARMTEFRKDERGYISLDLALSISALSSLTLIYLNDAYIKEREQNLKDEAEIAISVSRAVSNYVLAKRDEIETAAQAGPINILMSDLTTEGTLPTTFQNNSLFSKSYFAALVRTSELNFKFLTCGTGGIALTDAELNEVARNMGAFGGTIQSNNPSNYRTNGSSFIEPLAQFSGVTTEPAAGDYCMLGFFGKQDVTPDYVSRSRSAGGAADMSVRLEMASNNIQGVNELLFDGQLAGEGITAKKADTLSGLYGNHPTGLADTAATAETLVLRGADGTFSVAEGIDDDDVVNKAQMEAAIAAASGGEACGDINIGDSCDAIDSTLILVGFNPRTGKSLMANSNTVFNSAGTYAVAGGVEPRGKHSQHCWASRSSPAYTGVPECWTGFENTLYYGNANPGGIFDTCNSLTEGGYTDWFVPSSDEMTSILKANRMHSLTPPSDSYYFTSSIDGYSGSGFVGIRSGKYGTDIRQYAAANLLGVFICVRQE